MLATENAVAGPDTGGVSEAVYETYKPQRAQVTGARPHPGALVQSAAMATVLPPATDYKPRIPAALVKSGALSDAQLEAIVYAGHAHSDVMASGKRRGFFIGDGCVAAGTRIYNPVTGEHTPIEDLVGKKHWVLALTPAGFRPALATMTFRKGVAALYRVVLDDGRAITVTGQHRFLTPDGWAKIDDGVVRLGATLACSEAAAAAGTSWSPIRGACAPLGSQTRQDCQDGCSDRACGEPLPRAGGIDPASSPSPADVLARSHPLSRADDQAFSPSRSGLHQSAVHHSRRNWPPSASLAHALSASRSHAVPVLSWLGTPRNDAQSLPAIAPPLRSVAPILPHQPAPASGSSRSLSEGERHACEADSQSPPASYRSGRQAPSNVRHPDKPGSSPASDLVGLIPFSSAWHSITSIEPVGNHAFYDMYVPGPENYVAEGVVNHNTGVGKGREIAGLILDNFQNGRTKAVWISEKRALINDARRDWNGMGRPGTDIIDHGKLKPGDAIQQTKGILFSSYDTLKSAEQTKTKDGKIRGKERVDQIIEWLGKDFDGVIAFDEAHAMGNSIDTKGGRGVKKAAQKALAGVRLQKELPNARVVYVSATGATEVTNLAYADRLGLWGEGTAFPTREDFIGQVSSGGIAGMELVARDMKALGHYIARNLSYDGVDYDRVEHVLSADQRHIYDKMAEGWQLVLQHFNAAMEASGVTNEDGKALNSRAKSAVMSAFWGGHQRFFNQVITAMQMPSVIRGVEADLKAGRQAVLQLVNTMEAAQERALEKARAAGEGDLEDLDMTPRDQLMQMVEKAYPVQQMEEYEDDNGNVRSRPAVDSNGNPVLNRALVAARDRLLDELGSLRVPDGPLEMLLNHFGADSVAEVTGRKQRVVRKPDDSGELKTQVEQRGAGANVADASSFQQGKKKILVFSEAGGTGRSYHAENGSGSEGARRSHYLVQGGWRADKAVQGFGRTHRTNQASAPIFHLVTTDLQGQKRFISSIARRLAQLGALTKGERRAADQGMFGMRDNLESTEARDGLIQFFKDVDRGEVEGVTMEDLEKTMGLKMRDENGALSSPLPEMSQFLNRVLSLTVDHQNRVFQAFSDRMDTAIARASAAGTLDTGVETYKADKISKLSEQTVFTDPRSGAETKHVHLNAQNRNEPVTFEETLAGRNKTNGARPDTFIQNNRSGRVFAVTTGGNYTDADGRIIAQVRLTSPTDYQFADRETIDRDNWKRLSPADAKPLWDKQVASTPEFRNSALHIITGAVLPIWDRLGGNPKIFRLQTDGGERMLGRVIPATHVDATLRMLGAEGIKVTASPTEIATQVLNGATARLANSWTIKRSLVAGEPRLELVGPDYRYNEELARNGVFSERIAYTTRFFIPTEPAAAAAAIEGITKSRPVTSLDGGAQFSPRNGPVQFSPRGEDREEGRTPLYSALTRAVEGIKQERATPGQWIATLKNMAGVKPEERAWTGLDDWLGKQPKSVTKAEVLDYLRANRLDMREVTYGGDDRRADMRALEPEIRALGIRGELSDVSPLTIMNHGGSADLQDRWADAVYKSGSKTTKFEQYTLPGGENYREMLLTLPPKRSGAWEVFDPYDGGAVASFATEAEARADAHRRGPNFDYGAAEASDNPATYRSSHWDEPNVVAHTRFSERTAPDGKRVLHVEEVQSDWHQAGRKQGYENTPEQKNKIAGAEAERQAALTAYQSAQETETQTKREAQQADAAMKRQGSSWQRSVAQTDAAFDEAQNMRRRRGEFPTLEAYREAEAAAIERRDREMDRHRAEMDAGDHPEFTAWRQAQDRYGAAYQARLQSETRYRDAVANLDMQRGQIGKGVPDAPFKTTWPMLVMKRLTQYAVDHGFDRIAWTGGDVQADRYDLSKSIGELYYWHEDGKVGLSAYDHNDNAILDQHYVEPSQLSSTVGKEIAERIERDEGEEAPGHPAGVRLLTGDNLKIGGEGMKAFYDRQLPSEVEKLVRKFGAKVERSEVQTARSYPDEYLIHDLDGTFVRGFNTREAAQAYAADPPNGLWGSTIERRGGIAAKTQTVHSFDISDKMRQAVQSEGLPLFSPRQRVAVRNERETERWTPEQALAYSNVGRVVEVPTFRERIAAATADIGRRAVRYWLDPYIGVKADDPAGYVALRNANTSAGAAEMFLRDGTLRFEGSTYAMDQRNGGVEHNLVRPLHGEQDRFIWWVAANRAERLTAEDRENLWSQDDIDTLKATNQGQVPFDYQLPNGQITRSREAVYLDSLRKLDVFNKNTLDLAVQSGLLDGDGVSELFANPFYVPFYRVAEDDGHFAGPGMTSGFVKQNAFKTLKGGTQKLNNDLWDNSIKNWRHMIDASLRNRAASGVLDTALTNGAVVERSLREVNHMMSKADKKSLVWVMNNGVRQHFQVTDPMLFTAISALDFTGYNDPFVRAAAKFKTVLTQGVTSSPLFMLRNSIRDAQQAIAVAPTSYNVVRNLVTGFKMGDMPGALANVGRAVAGAENRRLSLSDEAADAIAGGATMHLGSGHDTGVRKTDLNTMLDSPARINAFWNRISKIARGYKEVAGEAENAQRFALYHKLVAEGVPKDQASFAARDLTDFSLKGAGPIARYLTQMVPFMNARLQGLYKVGRSAADQDRNVGAAVGGRLAAGATKRMAIVLGATTLATMALDALYADDEDFKKRSEYDRSTNWWFKFGGVQFRIPMGFEVAAMSRIASNGVEAFFGTNEMTARRFGDSVMQILGTNLSMNPTPQIVRPVLDLMENQNFAGSPIVGKGLDRLRSEEQSNPSTSLIARGASTAGNAAARAIGGASAQFLAPVQIDYLINGYFGWLGTHAVNMADMMVHGADQAQAAVRGAPTLDPVRPNVDLWNKLSGGMIAADPTPQSRYVDMLYQQADAVRRAYATYHELIARGRIDDARDFYAANKDQISKHALIDKITQVETSANQQIKRVGESRTMDGEQKRLEILKYNAMRNRAAESVFGARP